MRKLKAIEMHRMSIEQFKEAEKLPLIVVLDDVRSLYNVGSVFRCGDAFRVEAVYLVLLMLRFTRLPLEVRIASTGSILSAQKMLSRNCIVRDITCIVLNRWKAVQNFRT